MSADAKVGALVAWHELLGQVADCGGALARAITTDDVAGAIVAMTELRRARAASRVEAPAQLDGSAAALALAAETAARVASARDVEAVSTRWLARGVPGDAQLLRSPLGVAVLADILLPETWDYDTDAVILVGAELAPVAEMLAALGQRRIVLHDAPGATPSGVESAHAFTTASHDEIAIALRTMNPCAPGRFVVRAAVGVARADVEAVTETVRAALSDLRVHRNTVHAFSRTWIEQGAANLPAIARWPSIAALDGKFAGMPMVIVAPGPSLARNAHLLRELRGRAIVTAFSHSLKPVLAAGITPDLVLTVDPQDVRYHFAGADLSRTCLINAVTAHPSLFELGAPRCLTVSANSGVDDWMFDAVGEQPIAPGGGSVATTAYSLALRWQCDPIIFVGLDLSFPGGHYYVSTSTDGGARAIVDEHGHVNVAGWSREFRAMKARGGPAAATERAIELPAWCGSGTVPSSFMFSMFHRWFVDRTKSVTGMRVYNCTEGGAYIDGMMHRPLAEVIAALGAPIEAAPILDAAIAAVPPARRTLIAEHVERCASSLANVQRHARRALAFASLPAGRHDAALAKSERALAEARCARWRSCRCSRSARSSARKMSRAAPAMPITIGPRPRACSMRSSASSISSRRCCARRRRASDPSTTIARRISTPTSLQLGAIMTPRKKQVPRIIAVCGGKGGVGKSTIAANLGLAIGKLGHRVVIVDADLGAANLHTMLGVIRPKTSLADFFDGNAATLDEVRIDIAPAAPTVSLVSGTSRPGAANLSSIAKARLLRSIARLDTDVVILDVGAGTSFNVIDLVAISDIKLFVVTPQLPSIHNAYALLKACVQRVVRKLATDEDTGQEMIDGALGKESTARTIDQLVDTLRGLDAPLAISIEECLSRFGVGIIGNQLGADSEISVLTRISTMLYEQLHVHAPVLGAVRRSPSLGGGLKAGAGTIAERSDPSHAVFRILAGRLLDIDLAVLRGSARISRERTMPLWIQRELEQATDAPAAPIA